MSEDATPGRRLVEYDSSEDESIASAATPVRRHLEFVPATEAATEGPLGAGGAAGEGDVVSRDPSRQDHWDRRISEHDEAVFARTRDAARREAEGAEIYQRLLDYATSFPLTPGQLLITQIRDDWTALSTKQRAERYRSMYDWIADVRSPGFTPHLRLGSATELWLEYFRWARTVHALTEDEQQLLIDDYQWHLNQLTSGFDTLVKMEDNVIATLRQQIATVRKALEDVADAGVPSTAASSPGALAWLAQARVQVDNLARHVPFYVSDRDENPDFFNEQNPREPQDWTLQEMADALHRFNHELGTTKYRCVSSVVEFLNVLGADVKEKGRQSQTPSGGDGQTQGTSSGRHASTPSRLTFQVPQWHVPSLTDERSVTAHDGTMKSTIRWYEPLPIFGYDPELERQTCTTRHESAPSSVASDRGPETPVTWKSLTEVAILAHDLLSLMTTQSAVQVRENSPSVAGSPFAAWKTRTFELEE